MSAHIIQWDASVVLAECAEKAGTTMAVAQALAKEITLHARGALVTHRIEEERLRNSNREVRKREASEAARRRARGER